MTEDQTIYRFKGPDKFTGIPARDLTEVDYDALSIDQKRDVIASASYQAVEKKAEPKPVKKDGE